MSLALQDFGSYTVAGRTHQVTEGSPREVQFTRSASYTYDPRGHFSVEHAYVQYFVPAARKPIPPIVLVHGGGMHGSTWETTPDGRPGWLNRLLARGHEVHVLDNVERGRSGFAPGLWDDEPLLRSHEEAWKLFRIGAPEDFSDRRAYDGSRFPVSHFEDFCQRCVPRWLSTTPLHVAALRAVLEKLGEAIILCHSQGGEIAADAMAQSPERVAALIAIEPSTAPPLDARWLQRPTVLVAGDYLDTAAHWNQRYSAWQAWIQSLQNAAVPATLLDVGSGVTVGNSHFPMYDTNSAAVLDAILDALQ